MIQVTRINHVPLVLNSDLIEHIETTPDTIVSLTNGQKFMVLESADEIIRRVIAFRRQIAARRPVFRSGVGTQTLPTGSDFETPGCVAR
ncbi:MAG: flagellar FlbD family protein [Bryobacterales bacterium]|nr:flagellar FlbD family protein [Bryobacterales bacterium]MBV9400032.1 flagellar FlbD family protein [Bryobacterales bacterium]